MTVTALKTRSDVEALYDELASDVAALATQGAADAGLSTEIESILAMEGRLLDRRQFERWYELFDTDCWFWVPLRPDAHPGRDQSLYLDDHRRLGERVWRMGDTSAWALVPAAEIVRSVGSVEAWQIPASAGPREAMASSAIHISFVRMGSTTSFSARQVHRLRRGSEGWRIFRKTIVIPQMAAGTPHLGWLL